MAQFVARLVRISISRHRRASPLRLAVSALLSKVTPTGFLPADDQGAFFVVVQLPDGASIGRTSDVVRQVEGILKKETAIADASSIIGLNFIDNYSQPNAGFLIVTLKDFRGTKRRRADRRCDHRTACRRAAPGAGRNSGPACAAADHRAWHWRRLSVSSCRICGAARHRIWRR